MNVPPYKLSAFIQKKAKKIRTLIAAGRARADCKTGPNAAALDKMERFVGEFEALQSSQVGTLADWRSFVGRFCPEGWDGKLHFDHVLTFCFGFDETTARELRKQKHENKDEKTGEVRGGTGTPPCSRAPRARSAAARVRGPRLTPTALALTCLRRRRWR